MEALPQIIYTFIHIYVYIIFFYHRMFLLTDLFATPHATRYIIDIYIYIYIYIYAHTQYAKSEDNISKLKTGKI